MNKNELKRLAVEVRAEIGLGPRDVFNPWLLAETYGIDVYRLSEVDCSDEALQHFCGAGASAFSGALIPLGTGAVILENDSHEIQRRRSTLGHELAHLLRNHPFGQGIVNEGGCRVANPELEAEAAELGGELLLPFEAAKALARKQTTDEQAAAEFQVSIDIARWRLNHTGAREIARRGLKYRRAQ